MKKRKKEREVKEKCEKKVWRVKVNERMKMRQGEEREREKK